MSNRKSSGRMASKGYPNPVDVEVGNRLRQRRVETGITLKAIGEAMGISWQQIAKYELGQNRISASRLVDICKVLGVSIDYFFDHIPTKVLSQSPGALAADGGKGVVSLADARYNRQLLEHTRVFAKLSVKNQRAIHRLAKSFSGSQI